MNEDTRIALNVSETELELILLFMKVGLVVQDNLDLDMGMPDDAEQEEYVAMAEDLYERLSDFAKFEFLVRRIDNEDLEE